jgi:hypothetical protein
MNTASQLRRPKALLCGVTRQPLVAIHSTQTRHGTMMMAAIVNIEQVRR